MNMIAAYHAKNNPNPLSPKTPVKDRRHKVSSKRKRSSFSDIKEKKVAENTETKSNNR